MHTYLSRRRTSGRVAVGHTSVGCLISFVVGPYQILDVFLEVGLLVVRKIFTVAGGAPAVLVAETPVVKVITLHRFIIMGDFRD